MLFHLYNTLNVITIVIATVKVTEFVKKKQFY